VITDINRPSYFASQVKQKFFEQLTQLIERSPLIFSSKVGGEYFLCFVCNPQHQGCYEKIIKRLLVSYKQRDTIDKNKRSVFYCLMMKVLQQLADTTEQKALSILSTTIVDLRKNQELSDLPEGVATKDLARILIMQKVVKIF